VVTCEICGKSFEPGFGAENISGGSTAFKCPECAAKSLDATPTARQSRRHADAQFTAELSRVAPGQPLITYALIFACTAVFLLEVVKGAGLATMSPDLAIKLGANYGPLTLAGQWWRMFTSMFLHFGVIHLFMNMWCLLFLGALAERLMGRAAFLVLYVATGLFGSLLSLAVHPQLVSAGASGAVFGVAGGLVTYLGLQKTPLTFASAKNQLGRLALFLGINFFYSLGPGIDMMDHAGGVASGLVIAAVLPRFLEAPSAQAIPSPFRQESSRNQRVAAIGVACAIAIVIGAVGVRRVQGDNAFVLGSLPQIDAGHSADVLPRLKIIAAKEPDDALVHFALGFAELKTDDIADAVLELSHADTLSPGDAETEQILGAALLGQNSYDAAMPKFQDVLKQQPNNAHARLGLAECLVNTDQFQQAADQARQVLTVLPNESEAHAVLGQAEIRLGSVDDGIHEMETAYQLEPSDDLKARLLAAYMATGRSPHFADGQTPQQPATSSPATKTPTSH